MSEEINAVEALILLTLSAKGEERFIKFLEEIEFPKQLRTTCLRKLRAYIVDKAVTKETPFYFNVNDKRYEFRLTGNDVDEIGIMKGAQ